MPFNIPWFHPHSLSIRLPGLGVQVYPSGAKVYVVQTRAFGRSKRVTVGRHGTLTPDEARKQAARIIARIKAGESPVLNGPVADPTVGDLAERYQREYVAMHCKAATVSHYGLMLRKHIAGPGRRRPKAAPVPESARHRSARHDSRLWSTSGRAHAQCL